MPTPRVPASEHVYASPTLESLMPGALRQHIWLCHASVSLTLDAPDGLSRTSQIRRCVALGLDAESVLVVEDVPQGGPGR